MPIVEAENRFQAVGTPYFWLFHLVLLHATPDLQIPLMPILGKMAPRTLKRAPCGKLVPLDVFSQTSAFGPKARWAQFAPFGAI